MRERLTFLEFFAGGGMARAGLGRDWQCLFANDFDEMKAEVYRKNWGPDHFRFGDIATVSANELPTADLAWASFPCQDLSLAGDYRGLGKKGGKERTRSGAFWPFWSLMSSMAASGRAPRIIVLENVYGAITSNAGKDFAAIAGSFAEAGYRCGAVVVDAQIFVPQSRRRVFWIATAPGVDVPAHLTSCGPCAPWHPAALSISYRQLAPAAKRHWVWWSLRAPTERTAVFSDVVECRPRGVKWHAPEETRYLLSLMSEVNLAKVEDAKRARRRMVGGVYRRTRTDADGMRRQRAEVRFDDIAGCLRTPAGGSSRQTIIVVEGNKVRSRLLSPREAARLMGLDDNYELPKNYNDAYHLAGDGVVVPVVRYLAETVIEPILSAYDSMPIAAE